MKSDLSFSKKAEDINDQEEQAEDLSKKPKTPFTEAQLNAKWKSYCYLIQKEGKGGLYATLTKHPVVIKENFLLELILDNEIQELELSTAKVNLLNFLRKELNNYQIDLKTSINVNIKETKHLTNKDKFLQMAEKNPVLNNLREKLGLDIEY